MQHSTLARPERTHSSQAELSRGFANTCGIVEGQLNTRMCAQTRSQLQELFVHRRPVMPEPALCEHIAECTLCRGALALLLAEAVGMTKPPPQVGCDRCQRDLAALIDLEDAEGTPVAIQHYPIAWWHLWTCPTCAEVYQITRELLVLEFAELSVPPLPMPRMARPRTRLTNLDRSFLFYAAGSQMSYQHRGAPSAPIELISDEPISDDPADARRLTVAVRQQRNGDCRFDVRVQPPVAGELVFTLGAFVTRVPFDAEGGASVREVPFALIGEPTGPDLALAIEPIAAPG